MHKDNQESKTEQDGAYWFRVITIAMEAEAVHSKVLQTAAP